MMVDRLKSSIMVKILFIGFLILMLLIPLGMVKAIVHEREQRRNEAIQEVSAKWGNAQTIIGPILIIPYLQAYRDEKNIPRHRVKNAYFLPDILRIKGAIAPEIRARGMYEVILYRLDNLSISGKFSSPDFTELQIPGSSILWNRAFLTVGIPDTRGIDREIFMQWDTKKISFLPGVKSSALFDSGIHVPLKNVRQLRERAIPFSLSLNLQGSSSLSFVPLGKETEADLESIWQHPSFFGSYLPSTRKIDTEGFQAQWKISYFGRNFSQQWKEEAMPDRGDLSGKSFGVMLYQPVDFYQKCVRATKYGALFILLTFLTFFLFEVIGRFRIHPLQYLMVGCALCLFYLLFLSISEHIPFVASFIISSLGVIGLIGGYSLAVLRTRQRTLIITGLLTCLYAYLFILLQDQDYTLLLGSVALFMVLGLIMFITRKIDWYGIRLDEKGISSSST